MLPESWPSAPMPKRNMETRVLEERERVRRVCGYCWMKKSINASYIQLSDGAVQFNCILTDILPAGSVSYL